MIEKKFRCWDKKEKVMLYQYKNKGIDGWELSFQWWDKKEDYGYEIEFGYAFYNKKRFIIMQYAGIKDKNSKDIYESDIIEGTVEGNTFISAVKFENCFFTLHEGWDPEVIGNIYENPELLK